MGKRNRKVLLALLIVALLAVLPCYLAVKRLSGPASDLSSGPASRQLRKLIAREGKGYLETVDGYRVLHLRGTPEEMGYQHGVLLKKSVTENLEFLFKEGADDGVRIGPASISRVIIARLLNASFAGKIPERFLAEMKALAKGSAMPEWQVIAANLIPEMFHCSGFVLLRDATAEGKLMHGRVLDYGVEMRLQDHAVLIIQQPDKGIAFVNVSYAGFIGSVTGMNLRQVCIGEMGGRGTGRWSGIPMSFLVRMVLEGADNLDQAVDVFRNNARTCEYYYVISDAKADVAVGMKAVPEGIDLVHPGEKHELLPLPVKNTVLMSAGQRYVNLARLVGEGYGAFTQEKAIRLMDAPVAMKSNLHNALMVPADGVIYVANADSNGNPAWKQKYNRFDVRQLMSREPQ